MFLLKKKKKSTEPQAVSSKTDSLCLSWADLCPRGLVFLGLVSTGTVVMLSHTYLTPAAYRQEPSHSGSEKQMCPWHEPESAHSSALPCD